MLATLLLGSLVAGCTTEPTEVLVRLDTDVPADRRMMIVATVRGANMNSRGSVSAWIRTDGGRADEPGVDAGVVRFPASFAIIPVNGERDATVNLAIDATILPRNASESPVAFRRVARFRFTPGHTTVLPLFLSVTCASPSTGCMTVPANRCTTSLRCEESGRTCGDRGECVDPVTDPHPFMPSDFDGSVLASDASRRDGSGDGMDAHTTDPCGGCPARTHSTSMCVATMCVLACEAGYGNCDTDDSNGCESPLDAPEHCGTCGNTCPAGQLCASGNCVPNCAGGTTLCGRSCADLQTSPTNCGTCGHSCASGMQCIGGSCFPVCTGTTALCGTSCFDLQSDVNHCGACGTVCAGGANGAPACSGGRCDIACNGGFGNCDGTRANGCETDVTRDLAHCGACGSACAPANAAPACTSGLCGIAACGSGFADIDGTAVNGCECAVDSNGGSCAGPTLVAEVAVGGSTTVSGNLVPSTASDWFSVSFAPGGHPRVVIVGNPGGHFLRVQSTCGGPLACNMPITDWDFYDTPGPHTTRDVVAPTVGLMEVGSTGQTTCANYTVTISN